MKKKRYSPESLMMSYGYKPELSEGSIKPPIFQTSTFVFKTAEEGKAFFEVAYGKRQLDQQEELGLIYSRINNPDLEILEDRLTLWDGAEEAAAFGSGMSAITTVLLEFLNPGDAVLYNIPIYGGTHHFMNHVLTRMGIRVISFGINSTQKDIESLIEREGVGENLAMICIETPANPVNALVDMRMCAEIAAKYSTPERKTLVAVDNTYMGPLWQKPLDHGADLVMYSATKYIGGHSDVIAGAVLGRKAEMQRVKAMRTFLGNMCSPQTSWLLMRSLETLKVRMDQQQLNAQKVADFLSSHAKVKTVHYLGLLNEKDHPDQYRIYRQQCLGPGAMISFEIHRGEKEAFRFLNSLELIHLAVSLGSTESLAEHPATMTHTDIPEDEKARAGITESLIRLSVGVERAEDLIDDLNRALEAI